MCVSLSSSQPVLTYLHDINRRQSLAPQGPPVVHPIAVPCPHGNDLLAALREPWGPGTAPGWSYRPSGGAPETAPNLGACRFHDRCQLRPPIPPHHGLRGAANASHLVTIFGESNLIRISTDLMRTLPSYGPGYNQGTIYTIVRSCYYARSAN